MDPQLLPRCPPHTFQISDWKLVEDTTCMKYWIPYGGWMLVYDRIPMKAELVEGVVVLCGR